MKYLRLLLLLTLFCCLSGGLVAQETDDEIFVPTYSLGDQTLAINLGTQIPLFYAGGPDGIASTNLTLGGMGSLAWASYITNEFKLGIEVGGSFSFTPNRRTLFIVPFVVNAEYIFNNFPFTFPVSLGVGTSVARLEDATKFDPFLKAGGSVYWNFSSQWAFGANLKYWFIPQIYLPSTPAGPDGTRFGNFVELTLSALYHF